MWSGGGSGAAPESETYIALTSARSPTATSSSPIAAGFRESTFAADLADAPSPRLTPSARRVHVRLLWRGSRRRALITLATGVSCLTAFAYVWEAIGLTDRGGDDPPPPAGVSTHARIIEVEALQALEVRGYKTISPKESCSGADDMRPVESVAECKAAGVVLGLPMAVVVDAVIDSADEIVTERCFYFGRKNTAAMIWLIKDPPSPSGRRLDEPPLGSEQKAIHLSSTEVLHHPVCAVLEAKPEQGFIDVPDEATEARHEPIATRPLKVQWLGCYMPKDKAQTEPALPEDNKKPSFFSSGDCENECRGFPFFAMRGSFWCYCLTGRPPKNTARRVWDESCGGECMGESDLTPRRLCGTASTFAVYASMPADGAWTTAKSSTEDTTEKSSSRPEATTTITTPTPTLPTTSTSGLPPELSCVSRGCNKLYIFGATCQCTKECVDFGDCCGDFRRVCLGIDDGENGSGNGHGQHGPGAASTTQPSTTRQPTTEPPTVEPSTTESPTTKSRTTESPTTKSPATASSTAKPAKHFFVEHHDDEDKGWVTGTTPEQTRGEGDETAESQKHKGPDGSKDPGSKDTDDARAKLADALKNAHEDQKDDGKDEASHRRGHHVLADAEALRQRRNPKSEQLDLAMESSLRGKNSSSSPPSAPALVTPMTIVPPVAILTTSAPAAKSSTQQDKKAAAEAAAALAALAAAVRQKADEASRETTKKRSEPPSGPKRPKVMKGISYAPVPLRSPRLPMTGHPLPDDDFTSNNTYLMWGPKGRGDLKVIASLGANAVRLYGNDVAQDKGPFLDEAKRQGLDIIAGISDWPYLQMPNNCVHTDLNCFDQVRESYKANLEKGFLVSDSSKKVYHPALMTIILMNEPDLKFLPPERPENFCKAVVSAFDGLLDAEEAMDVQGALPNVTVTFSFGVCPHCKKYGKHPALGQMAELREAMRRPESVGYKAKHDLWEAYQRRFENSVNTASPASDFEHLFLRPYVEAFADVPLFVGEYHAPGAKDQQKDVERILKLAGDGKSSLKGISYFEFQARYDKGGAELAFGMFGLGDTDLGHFKLAPGGSEYTAWCLTPLAPPVRADSCPPVVTDVAYVTADPMIGDAVWGYTVRSVDSPDKCCARCMSLSVCKSWTWQQSQPVGTCRLSGAPPPADAASAERHIGAVSGGPGDPVPATTSSGESLWTVPDAIAAAYGGRGFNRSALCPATAIKWIAAR